MIYYAQNIQIGNANAQSSVINTVEGNGNVSTHIEVEANGDKKVLDTNSSGTYSLSVQSNNGAVSTVSVIATSESPIATATPKVLQKNISPIQSLISSFINRIQVILQHFKIL